jgi:lysophospholipase L1-like esterase
VYVPYVPSVRGYHDWLAEGYADQRIWRQQQDRLMAVIRLCRDRGVPLRVALIPYVMTGGEEYVPARVHAQVKQFLEANGVEVVDLLPTLSGRDPKTLIVNRDDPHPNEEAHRLFAEAIWRGFYED